MDEKKFGKERPAEVRGGHIKKDDFPDLTPQWDRVPVQVGDKVRFIGAEGKVVHGTVDKVLEEPEHRIWAVGSNGQRHLLRPSEWLREDAPTWRKGDWADFVHDGNHITGYQVRVLGVEGNPDMAVMHMQGQALEYTIKKDHLIPPTVDTLYEELGKLATVTTGRGDVAAAQVRQQVQDVYKGIMPINELTNGGARRLRDRLRAIMQREGKTIWETRERK